MRALEPEATNAVWQAPKALLPVREVNHPMGGHRRRIPDRICSSGNLDPVGDRLLMGDRRTPLGRSSVRYHTAVPTRRVDRRGSVRRCGNRSVDGLRPNCGLRPFRCFG